MSKETSKVKSKWFNRRYETSSDKSSGSGLLTRGSVLTALSDSSLLRSDCVNKGNTGNTLFCVEEHISFHFINNNLTLFKGNYSHAVLRRSAALCPSPCIWNTSFIPCKVIPNNIKDLQRGSTPQISPNNYTCIGYNSTKVTVFVKMYSCSHLQNTRVVEVNQRTDFSLTPNLPRYFSTNV